MRLPAATCVSTLLFALPAVAHNALLYLTPPSTADNVPATLNPSEARLVVAQQLGLSRYHSLSEASDETLQVINAFSSPRQSLFSNSREERKDQAFVIIEGVYEPESFVDDIRASRLTLSPVPTSSANADFVSDLRSQYINEHGQNSMGGLIFHDTSLETAAAEYGINNPQYRSQVDFVRKRLERFTSEKNTNVMLILVPRLDGRTTKRSTASWGSYSKVKRQHIEETALGLTPIEDEMSPEFIAPPTRPAVVAPAPVQNGIGALQSNSSTKPPVGILPYCFASEDGCKTTTHDCSGHGKCVKKYTDETHGQTSESCYSCSCTSTREDRGNGMYKTTQWAGPACQKKDVSTPFWLLGGTTVALVFAVGWGMSLLYAMGSEDLPSVISAGVSNAGARAK